MGVFAYLLGELSAQLFGRQSRELHFAGCRGISSNEGSAFFDIYAGLRIALACPCR
jgi:hypothetical protein